MNNIIKSSISIVLISLSATITNISSFAQNNKYSTLYYQRASLFEELSVDSNDIIFLGNSITHFGEWHEIFNNPNIKNRGISGDIAQGVYDRLNPILKGKPLKIFLLIGINDVSHNLTADSIINAIRKISLKIKEASPDTKLYIQSVMPVNPAFNMFLKATERGDVVKEINKGLEILCSDESITFIDIYNCLTTPGTDLLNPDFTNDGLHLMGAGYLRWAEAIKKHLEE